MSGTIGGSTRTSSRAAALAASYLWGGMTDLKSFHPGGGDIILGSGVNGTVYLYRHRVTDMPIAVKTIDLPDNFQEMTKKVGRFVFFSRQMWRKKRPEKPSIWQAESDELSTTTKNSSVSHSSSVARCDRNFCPKLTVFIKNRRVRYSFCRFSIFYGMERINITRILVIQHHYNESLMILFIRFKTSRRKLTA